MKKKTRSMLEVKQEVNPMFIGMVGLTAISTGLQVAGQVTNMIQQKKGTDQASLDAKAAETAELNAKLGSLTSSGGERRDAAGNLVNMNAMGGELQEFNEGGTHEQNPNGGVMVGMGANGKPNTVEEGETKFGDFVFSDRVSYTYDEVMPTFVRGDSFADASKVINNAFKGRNDAYSSRTKVALFERLSKLQEQEVTKIAQNNPKALETGVGLDQNQMAFGNPPNGATTLDLSNYDALKNYKINQGLENYDAIQGYSTNTFPINPMNTDFGGIGLENYDAMKAIPGAPSKGIGGEDMFGNPGRVGVSTEGQGPVQIAQPKDYSKYLFGEDPATQLGIDSIPEAEVIESTPLVNSTKPSVYNRDNIGNIEPLTTIPGTSVSENPNYDINKAFDKSLETKREVFNAETIRLGDEDFNKSLATKRKAFAEGSTRDLDTVADSEGWLAQGDNMSNLSAGIGIATQTAGIISNLISKRNIRKPKDVTPYTISKANINPNLVNRQAILREIINQESTTRGAIAENASGDFGAYASNVAGVHTGSVKASSSAMLGADIADAQEKARVEGVRLGIDKYNSGVLTNTAMANEQNEAAYEAQRLAYDTGIAANIGSLGQTLMNYGIATQASKYAGNAAMFNAMTF